MTQETEKQGKTNLGGGSFVAEKSTGVPSGVFLQFCGAMENTAHARVDHILGMLKEQTTSKTGLHVLDVLGNWLHGKISYCLFDEMACLAAAERASAMYKVPKDGTPDETNAFFGAALQEFREGMRRQVKKEMDYITANFKWPFVGDSKETESVLSKTGPLLIETVFDGILNTMDRVKVETQAVTPEEMAAAVGKTPEEIIALVRESRGIITAEVQEVEPEAQTE